MANTKKKVATPEKKKAVKVLTSSNGNSSMTIGEAFLIQVGLNKLNGKGLDGSPMMDYIDFKICLDGIVDHSKKGVQILFAKYNVKSSADVQSHPKVQEINFQMNRMNAEPIKGKLAPLNFIPRDMMGTFLSGADLHIQQKALIAKYLMAPKT